MRLCLEQKVFRDLILVALLRENCPSIRSKLAVGVGEGFLEVRLEGGAES